MLRDLRHVKSKRPGQGWVGKKAPRVKKMASTIVPDQSSSQGFAEVTQLIKINLVVKPGRNKGESCPDY